MFNEIVQGSQDVGVVVDDSRRPDEQFEDSSAALHEIRRYGDLEPETQEILRSMSWSTEELFARVPSLDGRL
jgi:hypothetical protein